MNNTLDKTPKAVDNNWLDELLVMNHPDKFWQIQEPINLRNWNLAIKKTLQNINLNQDDHQVDEFLRLTLGEERYGKDHWQLSRFYKIYWSLKPFLPIKLIRSVRSQVDKNICDHSQTTWPIDDRYTRFMWELLHEYIILQGNIPIEVLDFWPENKKFALVLTHDVETIEGQKSIHKVADMEEKHGLRSSFNLVGKQIAPDTCLIKEIRDRGFEVGIHGWQHNARPFYSRKEFSWNAEKINKIAKEWKLSGHRSPLNLRHPGWMQDLSIDYDLSFFDTDPFEPIPGGVMTIWPFYLGKFIELPATLVQDNTMVNLLGEDSPEIWFRKVSFIKKYHGMALLNSHPDYLSKDKVWTIYEKFLDQLVEQNEYWNALPRDVADWWKLRTNCGKHQRNNSLPKIKAWSEEGSLHLQREI